MCHKTKQVKDWTGSLQGSEDRNLQRKQCTKGRMLIIATTNKHQSEDFHHCEAVKTWPRAKTDVPSSCLNFMLNAMFHRHRLLQCIVERRERHHQRVSSAHANKFFVVMY